MVVTCGETTLMLQLSGLGHQGNESGPVVQHRFRIVSFPAVILLAASLTSLVLYLEWKYVPHSSCLTVEGTLWSLHSAFLFLGLLYYSHQIPVVFDALY